MNSGNRRIFIAIGLLTLITGAQAQTFARRPFLQKGAYNKATVCWRVSAATALTVKFGSDSANLANTSAASANAVDACVALDSAKLQPNTKYFYEVYNGTTKLAGSPKQFFITAPTVGAKKKSVFWILGDPGSVAGDDPPKMAQLNVRNAFRRFNNGAPLDGILLNGDVAYESGTDAELTSNMFNSYQDDFATAFAWSAIGNHEAVASSTGASYLAAFNFPTAGEIGGVASNSELYYSYDYGNIHFIILDSQVSPRTKTGAQYLWLQQDLQATRQDWIIAMWHHPPYTKNGHNSDTEQQLIDMRTNFLPLLEQYAVDVVYCGHSHNYERTYLLDSAYGYSDNVSTHAQAVPAKVIKDNKSGDPAGTGPYFKPSMKGAHQGAVYALVGSSAKLDPQTLPVHPLVYKQLVNVYGSGLLIVEDTVLTSKFIDSAGVVRDQFQIVKSRASGPSPLGRLGLKQDAKKFSQSGRRFIFASNNTAPFRVYSLAGTLIFQEIPRGIWEPSQKLLPTGAYYFRYGGRFGKISMP